MTVDADRVITSLRAHHDRLAAVLAELSPEELSGQSAADDWTIAQVVSHLGSGAQITGGTILGALGLLSSTESNEAIWARWDASTPEEQVAGFLEHDERVVAALEATAPDQRAATMVDLGFLPQPVPLVQALGMRLNEVALHTWDILAARDASATVDAEAAEIMLEQYAGIAAFMLGFIGKPRELDTGAVIDLDGYTLTVDDSVSLASGSPAEPTATLHAPHEAAYRLITGRLKPAFTADEVAAEGSVSLDDLRRVFPGY